MPTLPQLSVPRPAVRPRFRTRTVIRAIGLVALAAVVWEGVRVLAFENRHTVIPGAIYRSAQPSPALLRREVAEHGIRTVVNLRGCSPQTPWYAAETRAAHDLGLSQEDVTFSANRLPAPAELRRLIDVLDHSAKPLLIHCKRGADRTGLAATLVHLLYTDATLPEARRQLLPIYGHFEFGRTMAMDDFFDRYEAWLTRRGVPHTPDRFRTWAGTVYSPGPRMSKLEWTALPPATVKVGQPIVARVLAQNTSAEPWELQPGNFAGIHLGFMLAQFPETVAFRGQAGLECRTVPPGGEIEFVLAVPPQRTPGKFVLVAEMTDATGAGVPIRANSFVQFGDVSLLAAVDVVE
ncbi:MAG: tyrosine-protein phosphatase [Fimbriiglobus sp.]